MNINDKKENDSKFETVKLVKFGHRQYTTDEMEVLLESHKEFKDNFEYFLPSLQSMYDPTHGIVNESNNLVAHDDRDDRVIPNAPYYKYLEFLHDYKEAAYKEDKAYIIPLNIGTRKRNFNNVSNGEVYNASNQDNGTHWISITILPKEKTEKKEQDEIYILDSISNPKDNKNIVEFIEVVKRIAFPNAEVVYRNTQQQLDKDGNLSDGYSCGRWAIYNGLMLSYRGNIRYLDNKEPFKNIENNFDYTLTTGQVIPFIQEIQEHDVSISEKEQESSMIAEKIEQNNVTGVTEDLSKEENSQGQEIQIETNKKATTSRSIIYGIIISILTVVSAVGIGALSIFSKAHDFGKHLLNIVNKNIVNTIFVSIAGTVIGGIIAYKIAKNMRDKQETISQTDRLNDQQKYIEIGRGKI